MIVSEPSRPVSVRSWGTTIQANPQLFIGACCAAILTWLYTALYWNRFLAPSAGVTFFYAGELILQGKMPFRDFLFLGPPLHAIKAALLIRLFGDALIVARVEAVIQRTILAVLLFWWL